MTSIFALSIPIEDILWLRGSFDAYWGITQEEQHRTNPWIIGQFFCHVYYLVDNGHQKQKNLKITKITFLLLIILMSFILLLLYILIYILKIIYIYIIIYTIYNILLHTYSNIY